MQFSADAIFDGCDFRQMRFATDSSVHHVRVVGDRHCVVVVRRRVGSGSDFERRKGQLRHRLLRLHRNHVGRREGENSRRRVLRRGGQNRLLTYCTRSRRQN